MEEMYGFHSTSSSYIISPENNLILPANYNHGFHSSVVDHSYWQPFFRSDDLSSVTASVVTDSVSIETNPDQIILPRRRSNRRRDDDDYDAYRNTLKEKIVSHPSYPKLLDAYLDCQKVGAPVEIASLLDDIRHKNDVRKLNATGSDSTCLGVDPELDAFMETFCHLLMKYKSNLARPFDEATLFLGNIQSQLFNLGKVAKLFAKRKGLGAHQSIHGGFRVVSGDPGSWMKCQVDHFFVVQGGIY